MPGRVVKRNDVRVPQEDLDQVHLPDPISDDINRLAAENAALAKRLENMERILKSLEAGAEEIPAGEEK